MDHQVLNNGGGGGDDDDDNSLNEKLLSIKNDESCPLNDDDKQEETTEMDTNEHIELYNLNESTSNYHHVMVDESIVNNNTSMSQNKKSRTAAIPGKPRGATYDGNACMICSDRASGFHYGVLACEGCKGFFKRICKEPNDIQTKRHCVYGNNCDINLRTRNRCQYCRIQKCLQLGMSKDGIKLGRRSRKFKENLIQIVSTTSTPSSSSASSSTLTSPQSLNNTTTTTTTTTSSTNSLLHHIDLLSKSLLNNNNNNNESKLDLTQLNTSMGHNQSNSSSANNSFITISTDSQIQQIIIPSDQSHLITSNTNTNNSNQNKQVIAIIQDNRLILKTIDVPLTTTITQTSPTTTSAANAIAAVVSSSSSTSTTSLTTTQAITTQTPTLLQPKDEYLNKPAYQILDISQIQQINESILQAHKDTWPYLKDKCKKLKLQNQKSQRQLNEQYFNKGLINFLQETKFLEFFNQLIENTVLFAKIVPYFMDMHESDRIAMLKSCVFEIICVRHMLLFDNMSNSLRLYLPLYELFISKEYLMAKFPDFNQFIELLFDFYLSFFELFDLSDMEIAIFCSYLLFNTDDDVQLNDSEKLLSYRNLFRGLLINELFKNHGQQYKELDIHAWLDRCCLKLKSLNYEHSQILLRLKKSIQFPDLYAELYNL